MSQTGRQLANGREPIGVSQLIDRGNTPRCLLRDPTGRRRQLFAHRIHVPRQRR